MVDVANLQLKRPPAVGRIAIAAVTVVFVAHWPGAAAAQAEQRFELEWESPSVCPVQSEVEEQIHSLLSAAPGSSLPSHLRAKGVIEPVGSRFQLTLSIQVGQTRGVRVIQSEECSSLGKAAAVVLGLLIRKEQALGRELSHSDLGSDFVLPGKPIEPGLDKPQSEPVGPKSLGPTVPPDAPPQTHAEPTPRQWHLLVRAPVATVDFWTLPESGLGFGVAAGVLHRQWRWFASATWWLSQRRNTTDVETYSTSFKRKSFELWGCRGWRRGAFEAAPCIVTAMDLLNASASSARLNTTEQRVAMVSAGAGLSLHADLTSWLSLYLSTTGRLVANRRTFTVQEVTGDYATHSVPAGAWLTSVGSEWIF